MTWLLFASLTALSESLKDLFSKLGLKQFDEYIIAWAHITFTLPILGAGLLFIGIPPIGPKYLEALLIHGTLNTVAIIFYMRAVKSSELSVTIPMITFSPLFLLITSPILVGEYPSPMGLSGLVFIVAGSYFLHINQLKMGILAPIKALFEKPGPRYMLLVAFLWSITANYDKIGVENSSPLFWSFSLSVFMSLCMFPFAIRTNKNLIKKTVRNFYKFAPIGIFQAAVMVFQMLALQLTLVAYVVSIKRASVALCVLWGALFLKEKNWKEKLFGVAIMITGVTLIAMGR